MAVFMSKTAMIRAKMACIRSINCNEMIIFVVIMEVTHANIHAMWLISVCCTWILISGRVFYPWSWRHDFYLTGGLPSLRIPGTSDQNTFPFSTACVPLDREPIRMSLFPQIAWHLVSPERTFQKTWPAGGSDDSSMPSRWLTFAKLRHVRQHAGCGPIPMHEEQVPLCFLSCLQLLMRGNVLACTLHSGHQLSSPVGSW